MAQSIDHGFIYNYSRVPRLLSVFCEAEADASVDNEYVKYQGDIMAFSTPLMVLIDFKNKHFPVMKISDPTAENPEYDKLLRYLARYSTGWPSTEPEIITASFSRATFFIQFPGKQAEETSRYRFKIGDEVKAFLVLERVNGLIYPWIRQLCKYVRGT